ncbi:MAG: DUF6431 domain-containing protein [Clostridia bacterium]
MHLGDDVKAYVVLSPEFGLEHCPVCGERTVLVRDWYDRLVPHADRDLQVRIKRYGCHRRACRALITVLPDCLLAGSVYPAIIRDMVAEEYLSGRSTYEQIAEAVGCSKSTAWRWMRGLAWKAGPWLQTCRRWLGELGFEVGPLVLPEQMRGVWHRRRIRAAGMLEGLLCAGALAEWTEALRDALQRVRAHVLPCGLFALGFHVLDRLGHEPSHHAERHTPP